MAARVAGVSRCAQPGKGAGWPPSRGGNPTISRMRADTTLTPVSKWYSHTPSPAPSSANRQRSSLTCKASRARSKSCKALNTSATSLLLDVGKGTGSTVPACKCPSLRAMAVRGSNAWRLTRCSSRNNADMASTDPASSMLSMSCAACRVALAMSVLNATICTAPSSETALSFSRCARQISAASVGSVPVSRNRMRRSATAKLSLTTPVGSGSVAMDG